jgi:lipopolysaccharide/colanic/teichoic acid biosynthesis glycosyltransferase
MEKVLFMPSARYHQSNGVPPRRNQAGETAFGPGGPGGPAPARRYATYKRPAELLLSVLLFVLAAPVILLAALVVKLTSRGPVFYSQTRSGRNGQPFVLHKIRTMHHDCERHSGVRWATPNDPRITLVGHVLRRLHIDELPQLWNVLRGDMSLIGPRPERPEIIERLRQEIPNYNERLLIRPGMTGLAQVQLPPDSDVDSVRRKLRYDLYYLREESFLLDAKILLCTGFYLARIPFIVSKRWLGVPSAEVVEPAQPVLPTDSELVLQVQSV